jgi:hypothetical protein
MKADGLFHPSSLILHPCFSRALVQLRSGFQIRAVPIILSSDRQSTAVAVESAADIDPFPFAEPEKPALRYGPRGFGKRQV